MAKKKEQFVFGGQFAEFIKTMMPGAKFASGNTELICRCQYCRDSDDPTHGHMYIHIPQADDDPPMFHCFKCQTSGIVDSRTLIDWGLFDPVMGVEVDKVTKKASKNAKYKGYNRTWYPFQNGVYDRILAQKKVDYINQRIGTNLTISDCLNEKIILNLKDAVDYNIQIKNIENNYTRHPNIIQQLNDNFVGFLSLDNNFVNLRRICDKGIVYEGIDKRYINYNIHDKKDNTEKMYIIPTSVDLSNPYPVEIHIAEGPFDILSIKHNLRYNDNGIFAAVTGSGYKGLVMHLISTFQIFYFNLHVYPDNDDFGDMRHMNEVYNIIKPYGGKMFIHKNMVEGEKDFGVPLNRIKEVIYNASDLFN